MEPEGSLPHSQVPANCPYPEPNQSSPCSPIPLPEDPSEYYPPIYIWVLQVVSFLKVSHQNLAYTSNLPQTCYIPFLSHSSRFDHPNNIGRAVCISAKETFNNGKFYTYNRKHVGCFTCGRALISVGLSAL